MAKLSGKIALVTGATGKQGGAVVEALLTRGHQVRALTRNPASPAAIRLRDLGVEIAVGDFTDQDSLVLATRGTDAVYAMSTPYEQGAEKWHNFEEWARKQDWSVLDQS